MTNRMLSRRQNLNSERRERLLRRCDALLEESLARTRKISQLESQKAEASGEADKARLDAMIAAEKARFCDDFSRQQ